MSKTDFNELFYRPPTFCDECGELLNFEIFTGDKVKCQRCGGEKSLENIKNHYIETTDKYETSKVWVNKLKNREDKKKLVLKEAEQIYVDTTPVKVVK